MLTRYQFEVLSRSFGPAAASQRTIALEADISLGSVNRAIHELRACGYLNAAGIITEAGRRAIDPFAVESAVILAAGVGARIAPFSYERPKALLRVKGEVLIERIIRQLKESGVPKIVVVVGYMRESLFYLEEKFDVELVTSVDYANRNNHSSLLRAKNHLGRSYVLSADQYFSDNIFKPYVYETTCTAVFIEGPTKERALTIDRTGHVCDSYMGGTDEFCAIGPMFLDQQTSEKLVSIIEKAFDKPGTAGRLWESFLLDNLDQFSLAVKEIPSSTIHEFDFFNDLCAFDTDFIENVDSSILDNICRVFKCDRDSISGIDPIKEGLTNLSFLFYVNDKPYVYRHPGTGTDAIISREGEVLALKIAKKLGLDNTFVYEDHSQGWKISEYVPGCTPFDYENDAHVRQAMTMIRRLHDSGEI